MRKLAAIALGLAWLTGCSGTPVAPPPEQLTLRPVGFEQLPGFAQAVDGRALASFRLSCGVFARNPAKMPLELAGMAIPPQNWQAACDAAQNLSNGGAIDGPSFFSQWFEPYEVSNGNNETSGLLTAYYEPLLRGSRTQSPLYPYPVWGKPVDMWAGEDYLTHQEIDQNGLWGRATPLLFVNDKIDLFFMQIQGSGQVLLDDGELVKLGFAGKNNFAYTPIGRVLIDSGDLPKEGMSMQVLKNWLRQHPERADAVMWANESYVFFTPIDAAKGVVGAQGVPLTGEASIAVDDDFYPYGLPLFIDSTWPGGLMPLQRLVVAQDTGGAIHGVVRGDLFLGSGVNAESAAGQMQQPVRFWLLVPRGTPQGL